MPTRQEIDAYLGEVLSRHPNVPADVARRLMGVESGGNPTARSPKNAYGLMQLMPGTARDLGVDPTDWRQNIEGGVRYLSQNIARFGGDLEKGVAAYHAGPGAVEKAGGIPNTHDGLTATRDYVGRVLGRAVRMLPERQPDAGPGYASPDQESYTPFSEYTRDPDFSLPKTLPPLKQPDRGGFWEDTKNTLYSGFLSLAEDARELTRLALGDEVVAKIDGYDKALTGATLDERRASTEAAYSPEMAEALKKEWWDDEAGTFGPAATDWRSWYGGLMQSVPGSVATMVPGMIWGRGTQLATLGKMGFTGAAAKDLLKREAAGLVTDQAEKAALKAAAAAGARVATISGAILEGTQGGAQAGRGVREEILALPDSVLDQSEAFRALLAEHNGDRVAARRELANSRAGLAFLGAGVVTGIFGGMGDRLIFKLWAGADGGPVLKRLAVGALTEGAAEEFPQSYGSRVAENVAMQAADPGRRTLEGALGEGIGGFAVGSLMGGGMGVAFGRNRQLPPPGPTRETPPGQGEPLDDAFVSGSVAEGEGEQGAPPPADTAPPAPPAPPAGPESIIKTFPRPPEAAPDDVLTVSGELFKNPHAAAMASASMRLHGTHDVVKVAEHGYVLRPKPAVARPAEPPEPLPSAPQPASALTNGTVDAAPPAAPAAPTKLYHVTSVENRESILRNGLRASNDKTGMGAVFLTDTKPAPNPAFDVWEVDASAIKIEPDQTTESPNGERWYASYGDAPATLVVPAQETPNAVQVQGPNAVGVRNEAAVGQGVGRQDAAAPPAPAVQPAQEQAEAPVAPADLPRAKEPKKALFINEQGEAIGDAVGMDAHGNFLNSNGHDNDTATANRLGLFYVDSGGERLLVISGKEQTDKAKALAATQQYANRIGQAVDLAYDDQRQTVQPAVAPTPMQTFDGPDGMQARLYVMPAGQGYSVALYDKDSGQTAQSFRQFPDGRMADAAEYAKSLVAGPSATPEQPAPSAEKQQQPAAAPPAPKQAGQMPGATPKETEQIGEAFDDAAASAGDEKIHHLFDAPAKDEIVRLADKVKVYNAKHGWMTPAEAKAKINEWKKHAARQGDTNRNADKVVLSLFDLTGAWSQPWEQAGYDVWRFDIQNDEDMGDVNKFSTEFFNDWFSSFDGKDVYAILAACPCTDFASSGARHFAAKDADGRTRSSVELVQQTLATIEYFKPAVWAIENPVGRIEKLTGLPPWRLSFDPNHIGETYTKKTLLWGRFNADLPIAPVEPTEGSKMLKYGGKSQATKNARSVTPEGFAYSFFMANNAVDHPLMAISNKYDRLDKGAIKAALDAGLTESDIGSVVDDFYYMELDDDAANKALRKAAKAREAKGEQTGVNDPLYPKAVALFADFKPGRSVGDALKRIEMMVGYPPNDMPAYQQVEWRHRVNELLWALISNNELVESIAGFERPVPPADEAPSTPARVTPGEAKAMVGRKESDNPLPSLTEIADTFPTEEEKAKDANWFYVTKRDVEANWLGPRMHLERAQMGGNWRLIADGYIGLMEAPLTPEGVRDMIAAARKHRDQRKEKPDVRKDTRQDIAARNATAAQRALDKALKAARDGGASQNLITALEAARQDAAVTAGQAEDILTRIDKIIATSKADTKRDFRFSKPRRESSQSKRNRALTREAADAAAASAIVNGKPPRQDATGAERLVLIACSEGKLDRKAPALELYQGAMFDVLRKWIPTGEAKPNVAILSAKHGLLSESQEVEPYNQKLTPKRADELIKAGVPPGFTLPRQIKDVFIAGSMEYQRVMRRYVKSLMELGRVAPDASINATGGGIGEQRKQFGEYMRAIGGTGPAGKTALDENRSKLLRGLKEAGGIKTELAADITGENGWKTNQMLPGVISDTGMQVDTLADWLWQHNYISEAEHADVDGGNARALEIMSALARGQPVGKLGELAEAQGEALAAAMARSHQDAGLDAAEVAEIIDDHPDSTAQDLEAAFDAVAALDEAEIKDEAAREAILERAALAADNGATYEEAVGIAIRSHFANGAANRAEAPSEAAVEPATEGGGSFTRQVRALTEVASRHGWQVVGGSAPERIVLKRHDGGDAMKREFRQLVAGRVSGGNYHIEVSRGVTAPKRGVNALNIEGEATEFSGHRALEWDGKRTFASNEIFSVLRDYIAANPGEVLSSYTNAEVLAREEAARKAEEKAAAEKAAAEEAERQRILNEDIKRRSEKAAGLFELGGNAIDNLTGQGGLFEQPAALAAPAKPLSTNMTAAEMQAEMERKRAEFKEQRAREKAAKVVPFSAPSQFTGEAGVERYFAPRKGSAEDLAIAKAIDAALIADESLTRDRLVETIRDKAANDELGPIAEQDILKHLEAVEKEGRIKFDAPHAQMPSVAKRSRMSYAEAVASNMKHMGTPAEQWSAVGVTGTEEAETPTGRRAMPVFDMPRNYTHAPTLFPSQGTEANCELCSTPIKNAYWIKNDEKRWVLMVGSECVTHFGEGKSGEALSKEAQWQANRQLLRDAQQVRGALVKAFRTSTSIGYGRFRQTWRGNHKAEDVYTKLRQIIGTTLRADPGTFKYDEASGDAAISRWANANRDQVSELIRQGRLLLEGAADKGVASEPSPAYAIQEEAESDGYQQETLPEARGVVSAPRGRRQAASAAQAPAQGPVLQPAGVTVLRRNGTVAIGLTQVTDAKDAAHVFASLRKSPNERFSILLTDANDRPVGIAHMFAGGLSQTGIYGGELVKLAYATPGAKNIWMAHNHPSGVAAPSRADQQITTLLSESFSDDLGITLRSHIIIAGGRYAVLDKDGNDTTGVFPKEIRPLPRLKSVPIIERVLIASDPTKRETVTAPDKAKALAAREFPVGSSGIVWLNAQHQYAGKTPMTLTQMQLLRGTGRFAELMRDAGKSNAAVALVVVNENVDRGDWLHATRNIHNALHDGARDMRVLDSFRLNSSGTLDSAAEKGEDISPDLVMFAAEEQAGSPRGWSVVGGTAQVNGEPGKVQTDAQSQKDADAFIAKLDAALQRLGKGAPLSPGAVEIVALPDHSLIQTIAGVFGKRVVGFRTKDPRISIFGGASGIQPDVIYIRVDTGRPHLSLLGHELLHELRKDNPQLYATFRAAIRPLLNAHFARFGRDAEAWAGLSDDKIMEEFLADLIGDGFMRRAFWKRLGEVDPTLLQRIYNAVLVLIDKIYKAIGGYTPRSREYLKDYETAIKIAGEIMAEYGKAPAMGKGGVSFASASGPLWRSVLSEAIGKAPFAKNGTIDAAQLARWLEARSKDGTVKPDEVEWSGIKEWLTMQPRVSRDQVVQFLDQNGVRVTEKMLGEAEPPAGWKLLRRTLPNNEGEGWEFTNGSIRGYGETEQEAIIDAKMKLEREARRWQKNGDEEKAQRFFAQADEFDPYMENRAGAGPSAETTKFASYQLPGGKNYRELLLTLPANPDLVPKQGYRVFDRNGVEQVDTLNIGIATRELARNDGGRIEEYTRHVKDMAANFHSSHFDEPNILAHVRFNERTSADGKRVLFIEEIQSDHAQIGRKEGFGDKLKTGWRMVEQEPGFFHLMQDGHTMPRAHGTREAVLKAADRYDALMKGVPRAPYVGKTEAWVALALKRMIRYASDNGFDGVAWTTGEQQADRYDLAKQVDRLVYYPESKTLEVDGRSGFTRTVEGVDTKKLEDYVGKEAANRLVNNPTRKADGAHILEGSGLKVGGEGMRGFYDKIVPSVANEVLRKLGGGKVGEVYGLVKRGVAHQRYEGPTLTKSEVADMLDSDDARHWSAEVRGQLQDVLTHMDRGLSFQQAMERFGSWSLADGIGGDMIQDEALPTPQPGFDITPALRERALEGMPLFAMEPPKRLPDHKYRVMRRTLGNLTKDEKVAFDAFLATRPDAELLVANLKKHKGTPWAMQAMEGIFVRQAMRELIAGREPTFQSALDNKHVAKKRNALKKHGIDGLWSILEHSGGIMAAAAKPVNNVSSSFINCNPSKNCAKYCYATGGLYKFAPAIVKSEMVTLAVELDPVRAAERVAREYRRTTEFENNKALRLFDKGDASEAWVPFVKELNERGVRVQVFSKSPEFLRKVSDANVRLLSIDNSNLDMADQHKDLPVAFIYAGKEDAAALAKLVERGQVQVILPVKVGQRVLTREEIQPIRDIPTAKRYLCPIDGGIKALGSEADGKWNCTSCDNSGQGLGCYYGQPTKALLESLEAKPDTPAKARRILELRKEIDEILAQTGPAVGKAGRVDEGRLSGLLREVDVLLGELLRGYDERGEAGALGQAGRGAGGEGSGGRGAVWGRRVIPIRSIKPDAQAPARSGEDAEDDGVRFAAQLPIDEPVYPLSVVARRRIEAHVGAFLNSAKVFNVLHRTVSTQAHKAWRRDADGNLISPEFHAVFRETQDYLYDTSKFSMDAADAAPTILPKMEGWREAAGELASSVIPARRQKRAADLKAVAELTAEATLANERLTRAQVLERGLTEEQATMFMQARAAIDKSLIDLAASSAANMTRNLEGWPTAVTNHAKANPEQARDIYADQLARMREVVVENLVRANENLDAIREGEIEIGDQSMEEAIVRQEQAVIELERAIQTLDETQERLDKLFDNLDRLIAEGYAPLMRFGRWGVTVLAPETGEVQYFGMYETEGAALDAQRQLAQIYPNSEQRREKMAEHTWKLFQGTDPEAMAMLAEDIGIEQDVAFQRFYQLAVSNRGALKRLIHRKGTPGFDDDIQRTLAAFVTSNARLAARNYHFGRMLRLAKAAADTGKGDVGDEAEALVRYVQNPVEEAQALRSFLFFQFLGGSVAAALVNATQPVMMTTPYLSQFSSPSQAAVAVLDGMRHALGRATADPELAAALQLAEQEGVTAPHEMYQLTAEASRVMVGSGAWQKFSKLWGSLFSLAEAFNRKATFVAAFNMGRAMSEAQRRQHGLGSAFEFAVRAVQETQGIYNRGNRPNWARTAAGATIFTFRQFSIAYAEFLIRLPKRERLLALALLVLAAGLQGLPFAEDIEDIIDTVGQSLGYATNSKRALRDLAANVLGEYAGAFLTHGVSEFLPVDVHSRLGLGNMIPGTALLKRSATDKGREIAQVLGPVGGLAQSAGDAYQALAGGNVGKALEVGAPKAIRDAIAASHMWTEGIYKDRRGRRVADVSPLDAAIKAIGFHPAHLAREQRVVSEKQADVALARLEEDEIASLWARSIVDNTPEDRRRAQQRLRDWNARNPTSRIAITPAQINKRVREMKKTRVQRAVSAAPPEMREDLKRAITR